MEREAERYMALQHRRRTTSSGKHNLIRDHMDGIFDARGFFRKHVAHEASALFRSVSDVLFGTQRWASAVKSKMETFEDTPEGVEVAEMVQGRPHKLVYMLANCMNLSFDVVDSSDDKLQSVRIVPGEFVSPPQVDLLICRHKEVGGAVGGEDESPGRKRRSKDGRRKKKANESLPAPTRETEQTKQTKKTGLTCQPSSADNRWIFLCFTKPNQYDPVYSKRTVDTMALVQSIVYDLLYSDVMDMPDARHAARIMLCEEIPNYEKPTVFNRDFEGTALEALDHGFIPFPYKVAKALDEYTYRNIDYDVWQCARIAAKPRRPSASLSPRTPPSGGAFGPSSGSGSSYSARRNIGTLQSGTPCAVRDPTWGTCFGFVIQPTPDRTLMEVYLPQFGDARFYYARSSILPLKNPPEDIIAWSRPSNPFDDNGEEEEEVEAEEEDEEDVLESSQLAELDKWNRRLIETGEVQECDFSVPPPLTPLPPEMMQMSLWPAMLSPSPPMYGAMPMHVSEEGVWVKVPTSPDGCEACVASQGQNFSPSYFVPMVSPLATPLNTPLNTPLPMQSPSVRGQNVFTFP